MSFAATAVAISPKGAAYGAVSIIAPHRAIVDALLNRSPRGRVGAASTLTNMAWQQVLAAGMHEAGRVSTGFNIAQSILLGIHVYELTQCGKDIIAEAEKSA